MKRWLPHPVLTPLLALIWCLLNNSFSPGHLILGFLLGWAIPFFTRAYWPERLSIARPGALLRFLAVFFYDMIVANIAVAGRVIAGPGRLRPAFVVVPLALHNPFAISVLANALCLTPGSVSARLSPDRRHLLVHLLDCPDPAAFVREVKTRYEAPLQEVFETC